MKDLLTQIQSSVRTENLQSHLEWFSQVRRDTGGPGEDLAVDYIVQKLKEYGVSVSVHEFDAFLSYPRKATLEVLGSQPFSIPCLTHSFCQSTAPDGLVGELTFFPEGDASKTGGAIALLDGLLAPIKVLEASKAGAQALIFANEDRVIHNMIGTTIWGTPSLDQIDRLPSIPVISINRQSGERLKNALNQGPVTVRIITEVETGWYRSKLPEAVIRGTEEPESFVLVGAHYCAWEVGITDNATGDATLLEMARILTENQSQLKRSVRICWWPGHSHGRYSGSTWYADTFHENITNHCITYHNIDSPGVKGATMYVARHTSPEIQSFCQSAIAELTGQMNAPIHRPSRAADQSFIALGVPSFSCYPFLPEDHPDRRPWTGGCANAWWWHSSEDTLDKADVNILTLDTKISSCAVARLCTVDILPIDLTELASEINKFAAECVEFIGNRIDLGVFTDRVKSFLDSTQNLASAMNGIREDSKKELINRTLMRISRIVNPVVYSKGGSFGHDAAEWSPIMRNTKSSTFPALSKALLLRTLENSTEYGFLRTQIVRELNRVNAALKEAAEVCNHVAEDLLL